MHLRLLSVLYIILNLENLFFEVVHSHILLRDLALIGVADHRHLIVAWLLDLRHVIVRSIRGAIVHLLASLHCALCPLEIRLETLIQSFDQVVLLSFQICFIGVPYKVDVFSLLPLLLSVFSRVERLFFIELIEPSAVIIT
jgi:hypothetical protein